MPVFVDLDGDGDLDAAVGNNTNGLVKYFQNIGSTTSPVFDLTNPTNPPTIPGIDAGTTAIRASPTSTATATSTPSSEKISAR